MAILMLLVLCPLAVTAEDSSCRASCGEEGEKALGHDSSALLQKTVDVGQALRDDRHDYDGGPTWVGDSSKSIDLVRLQMGAKIGEPAQPGTSFSEKLPPPFFWFWGHVVKASSDVALLQQELVIAPPSTEVYQLEKGTTAPSYSQFNQDKALLPILSQLGAGFFVESGALDGEFCSNTLYYEINHRWNGLLVEPDPRYFPKIHSEKHRHAYAFNGALSPSEHAESLQFTVEKIPGWSKITNNGEGASHEISSVLVQAQPLHLLLDKIGQSTVDFWSLDIEGSEGKVLKGTDFSKVLVGVMLIEMNKNDENNNEIREVMAKEGFQNIGHTDLDQIFINPKYFQKRGLPVPTSELLEQRYRN